LLIALIVAMSRNRVIGVEGQLPWHLPADLQRFKQLTMGQTLLLGRKTYESIGRPLPGRQMLILSRNPACQIAGCRVVNSLPAALAAVQTAELFIGGGAELYRQALPLAEKIYLTELQREISGDRFFPPLPVGRFRIDHREALFDAGESCIFTILQREPKKSAEDFNPHIFC
jgi:dihydrofolate reductase